MQASPCIAPVETTSMAEKEATVYVVDMGLSMGTTNNGRKESDFDWAMTYVWEKITSTVYIVLRGSFSQYLIVAGSSRS